jgi:hypothetical protein
MEKINLAQYKVCWQAVVNSVMSPRIPLWNLENAQFYIINLFVSLRMQS